MKIEQLRQLLEVAKTKSINQAAMNLYISQPNLSMSLRKLEAELGYPLFTRNNRGIDLTAQGEKFLESASSVLLQFDQLKSFSADSSAQDGQSFSLGNMHFRYVIEAAASLFNKRHRISPFKMSITEGSRDKIIDLVYRGDAEIGVLNIWSNHRKSVLSQFKAKDIQYYRLDSAPPSIVVGKGSPLYSNDPDWRPDVEILRHFPHVMYDEFDFGAYDRTPKELGLDKSSGRIVVNDRATLMEIMEQTDAFMLAGTNPKAYTHSAYYPNAKYFQIANTDITCEVGWIKRKDYSPSALALEFIQILSSYYA